MAEASHEDDVNIEETDQDLPDQKQTSETGATKRVDAVRAQRLGLPLKSTNTDTSTATSTVTTKPAPVDWKTREEQRMKRFGTPSPADKLAAREQRFASDNTAKSTSNGSPSTKPSPVRFLRYNDKIKSSCQHYNSALHILFMRKFTISTM